MNRFFSLGLAIALIAIRMVSPTVAGVVDGVTYSDVFVAGTYGYDSYRIPSIVSLNDGTLLAFADGHDSNSPGINNVDIVVSRSTDYGVTWSAPSVVWSNDDGAAALPCPVVDRATGNVILVSNHSTSGVSELEIRQGIGDRTYQCQISSDGGYTWTDPTQIMAIEAVNPYWLACGPCHAIQLQRGENAGRLVLAGNHSIYTTETESPECFAANELHTIYSDDGGLTWELGVLSGDTGDIYVSETSVTELPDGTLYYTTRDQLGPAPGTRAFVTSSDGGETFNNDLQMDLTVTDPVCQGSILEYSAVDLGDSQNRVIMSYPNSTTRDHVSIRSSYDNCQTWTTPQLIYEGSSAYSDLVRTGANNDRIGILFERDSSATRDTYAKITFATVSADWNPPPLSISATFEDADGTGVDSYAGVAGNGWKSGWGVDTSGNGSITPTLNTTNPLYPDSYTCLSCNVSDNTSTLGYSASLNRQYHVAGLEDDYTIAFSLRFDDLSMWTDMDYVNSGTDGDRFFLCGTTDDNYSHQSAETGWSIRVQGNFKDGSLATALQFRFLTGATGNGSSNTEYSGFTVEEDHVYEFLITVHNGDYTYEATVTDVTSGLSYTTTMPLNMESQVITDYLYFGTEMRYAGGSTFGYSLDRIAISAVEESWIPGDANKDGFVDGSDATILANYWQYGVGATNPDATWEMGDFNGDHVVDGSDATLLASHWQEGTPPPAAVPEPSAIFLILAGLVGWVVIRSGRKGH